MNARRPIPARPATRLALVAVITAAVLVPNGIASASPSIAAATNRSAALTLFPDFAALPDSLGLAAPVLLHGKLTQPAGSSLAGATVLLSAWPSNEAIKAMPVGSAFSLTPIARTAAARDGSYTLRSAVTPLISSLLGKDGLDVQLDLFHAGRQYSYLSQVQPVAGGSWVLPRATEVVASAASSAATARNALDLTFATAQGIDIAPDLKLAVAANRPSHHGDDDDPTTDPGPHPFPGAWCVQRKAGEREAMTTVATALAHKGVTADVSYTSGARSTMSTGVSLNAGASFAIGGERTRTSEFTGNYESQRGTKRAPASVEYLINMTHAVINTECVGNTEREIRVRQVRTSPMGPAGGGRPIPSRLPIWKCANVEEAVFRSVETQKAQAYTYTRGFSFTPANVGSFTGEALSGYSDTVKVTYSFKHPERGRWCGHTSNPLAKGQLVQAFEVK